jgi:hypothetical protein
MADWSIKNSPFVTWADACSAIPGIGRPEVSVKVAVSVVAGSDVLPPCQLGPVLVFLLHVIHQEPIRIVQQVAV